MSHLIINTALWLGKNPAKAMPKIAFYLLCPGLKKYHYIINSCLQSEPPAISL